MARGLGRVALIGLLLAALATPARAADPVVVGKASHYDTALQP